MICQATASPAPAQDVARRIRRAWWARFTGNGITRYERGTYDLVGSEELSDAERDVLLQLCRQRLGGLRSKRGEEVFAHSSRHRTPITGSVKYRVLTRGRGRCEYCGANEHERAQEADNIRPIISTSIRTSATQCAPSFLSRREATA